METRKISKSCSIYKGEGRILIIPNIQHMAGFFVHSDKGQVISEFNDYIGIARALWNAEKIIEKSPMAKTTPKEREANAVWKRYSKYKTQTAFWKNNYYVNYVVYENGEYEISSAEKIKGGYGGCIKEIILPPEATAEELGKAVMEVFDAAEEYYKENKF